MKTLRWGLMDWFLWRFISLWKNAKLGFSKILRCLLVILFQPLSSVTRISQHHLHLPKEHSSQKTYEYCTLPYFEGKSLDEFFEVMCNFDRLLINKKISVDNICRWGFIWPNECLLTVMFGIQSREKNRQ